jgi:hypothetical protein
VDEVRTENSSKTLPEAEAMEEQHEGKVGSPLQISDLVAGGCHFTLMPIF